MRGQRILVTGATGFVGQHLVRALCEKGAAVRALVRAGGATQTIQAWGAELVTGDILDCSSLRTALRDIEVVFHLAGRLHLPGVTAAEYERLHVEGTRNLLIACLNLEALRVIVHCSTTGVLGPTGLVPAAEDTRPLSGPSNAYEGSKARGEQLALTLAQQCGLPLVVARPSLVYGPGDLHLLGWFRAIQRGYYRVVGPGDNLLHPIYITDLIVGLLRCAQVPAAAGRIYHLVGSKPLPIKDLAAAIAQAVGRPLPQRHLPLSLALMVASLLEASPGIPPAWLPLTRSRIAFMTESRAYCGTRARMELNFIPQVDLPTGLQHTVAWYRSEGLL